MDGKFGNDYFFKNSSYSKSIPLPPKLLYCFSVLASSIVAIVYFVLCFLNSTYTIFFQ